jgi:hypothetical protein
MRRFWWAIMRQSDAITALLARNDRFKGSSAVQLSTRATGFREIEFAKGGNCRSHAAIRRASGPDCGWPGACRVVTDEGQELGLHHTVAG